MIENERIARQICDLMLEFGARLDESVLLVKNGCSEEELKVYRISVGEVMANMLTERRRSVLSLSGRVSRPGIRRIWADAEPNGLFPSRATTLPARWAAIEKTTNQVK